MDNVRMALAIIKNACVMPNSNTTLLTAAEITNLKDKAALMSITLPVTTNATATLILPGPTTAILVQEAKHNTTAAVVTIIAAVLIPALAVPRTTQVLMQARPNAAHLVTTVKVVLREAPLILVLMQARLNVEVVIIVQTPATVAASRSAVLRTITRFG